MMAVFFFIAHEKGFNFMRDPKLAHILVLACGLQASWAVENEPETRCSKLKYQASLGNQENKNH